MKHDPSINHMINQILMENAMFDNRSVDESEGAQSQPLANRRNILKSLAAGGAIAAGAPVATGKENGLSKGEMESILQEPAVTQIRKIVGKFDISQANQKQVEVSGQQVTVTELKSEHGVLTYSEVESGAAEAKFAIEDLTDEPTLGRVLADEYESIPVESGMAATLISGGDSSVQLMREATSEESRKLRISITRAERGVKVEEAVYDSEIQGYRVFTKRPGKRKGKKAEGSSDISQYLVGAGEADISASSVELVDQSNDDVVTIQGCPFTLGCFNCASAVAARGICLASCAKGPGPLCLACVINTTFYPLACVPCLRNCA